MDFKVSEEMSVRLAMIEEIKKPVDKEINGSARKAELQSIKQTAIDCKELLVERQRLEQAAGEGIVFLGNRRDVPELLKKMDLFVLTSINEGTPVSIIEAMAAGVPVAATDAGGVRDLLGAPVATEPTGAPVICERGLRCEIDDAAGLAAGWTRLLDPDAGKNVDQIHRAREFVVRRYSQERLLV